MNNFNWTIIAVAFLALMGIIALASPLESADASTAALDTDIISAFGLPSGDSVVATTSVDRLTIKLDRRDGGYVDAVYDLYEDYADAQMVLAGDMVYVYVLYPNFGLKRYGLELPEGTLQAGYVYLGERLLVPILEK
jgi:hypothetical protein